MKYLRPRRLDYKAGLRWRGDVTLWLDEAAVTGWQASRRTTPGGQPLYSDLAIELVLILRLVFHLACAPRQHDPPPEAVIPSRASAVLSNDDSAAQSARDHHIWLMAEKERMAWQWASGYDQRNHVETTVGRCEHLLGPKRRARGLPAQQGGHRRRGAQSHDPDRKPVSLRRA